MVRNHRDVQRSVGSRVDCRLKDRRRPIVEDLGLARQRVDVGRVLAFLVHVAHADPQRVHEDAIVDAADVVAFEQIRDVVDRIPGVRVHLIGDRLEDADVLDFLNADDVGRLHDVANLMRHFDQSIREGRRRQDRRRSSKGR